MIGRALVRRGELLAVVDVSPMSGALALYPGRYLGRSRRLESGNVALSL